MEEEKSILSKWFLPTATSRSHPASPTGSPETRRRAALHKQGIGRRMSPDVVGGGRVVGVGEGYGEDPRYVRADDTLDADGGGCWRVTRTVESFATIGGNRVFLDWEMGGARRENGAGPLRGVKRDAM